MKRVIEVAVEQVLMQEGVTLCDETKLVRIERFFARNEDGNIKLYVNTAGMEEKVDEILEKVKEEMKRKKYEAIEETTLYNFRVITLKLR